MNETIIVGYDGSEESRGALAYASRRVDGGCVYIVSAADRAPDYLGAPHFQHFVDAAHARARALLDQAAAEVPDGVRFETELLEGPAPEAIVRVAETRDADEIVLGSRGLGRVQAILGSVSHDVLHLTDRPVVVIPARKER